MTYGNKPGYINTLHPVTGEKIQAMATGKTDGSKSEFQVLTPGSNLDKIWLQRGDILTE